MVKMRVQSKISDPGQILSHKYYMFILFSYQAQAIPFIWTQQFTDHHRMESCRATNRSENCWLPHQSRKGDRADRSLQSWNR